jgi:hypothetical protein
MVQMHPDWTQDYASSQELEVDMMGHLNFRGPGLYLSDTDTLLVIPNRPDGDPTLDNIWNAEQPEGTRWTVHVWNCPFSETIFLAMGRVPVRMDGRNSGVNGLVERTTPNVPSASSKKSFDQDSGLDEFFESELIDAVHDCLKFGISKEEILTSLEFSKQWIISRRNGVHMRMT